MSAIRVLVVDDHPVVRGGVVGWLAAQPDIDVVGEAGDGLEALAMVASLTPDVVLMDLRMPRMDGATATGRLAADHPAVRVLVLTTYDTDADIVRAVEAGARGYLLKDAPTAVLADAIRRAHEAGDGVTASPGGERMNEPKPHALWAHRTLTRARAFGVLRADHTFLALLEQADAR